MYLCPCFVPCRGLLEDHERGRGEDGEDLDRGQQPPHPDRRGHQLTGHQLRPTGHQTQHPVNAAQIILEVWIMEKFWRDPGFGLTKKGDPNILGV